MTTKKSVPKKRVAVKTGVSRSKKVAPKKKAAPKRRTTKKVVAVEDLDIHQPAAVPLMMYRRIAVTFTLLVAAALVIVLYLSTVQAVIHIDSTEEAITTEFITNVFETPTTETDIRGVVLSGTLGDTRTFVPTGQDQQEVEGTATGTVTIFNNLSTSQPLVATTRFLSPDGVLFRLEDGVTVPSGGSVEASVYADVDGGSGDIGPTTFTIPGLSAAKQELVYAESLAAFSGGLSYISVVSQEELDTRTQEMVDALTLDAQTMLIAEAGEELDGVSYDVEILEQTSTVAAGEEADAYELTVQVQVSGVFFDQAALETLALAKLYEGLGQGQEFVGANAEKMTVRVEDVSEAEQHAVVHVTLASAAVTSETSQALDVGRFIGMTEEEVRDLLVEEGIATGVDVEFFPFWIKTIPRLKDHIYIEIQ